MGGRDRHFRARGEAASRAACFNLPCADLSWTVQIGLVADCLYYGFTTLSGTQVGDATAEVAVGLLVLRALTSV